MRANGRQLHGAAFNAMFAALNVFTLLRSCPLVERAALNRALTTANPDAIDIALQQALIPVRLALHELLRHGAASEWTKLQATCQDLLRHWDAVDVQSHGWGGADEQCGGTGVATSGGLAQKLLWHAKCAGQSLCRGDAERAGDMCPTGRQSVRVAHGCGARRLGRAARPIPFLQRLNGY